MNYDVIVIGGGPSGLMASIAAAEEHTTTLLIEKGNKLGKKLAISGGGRCNVTNRLPQEELIKNIPGNGKFLYSAFSVFNNYDIIDFFENLGVQLKEEDHGRMFPVTNRSQTVINALLNKLESGNVEVRLNTPVEAIHYTEEYHEVILKNGEKITAKSIVIAVGGKAVPHTGSTGDGYAWAKKAGHTVTTLFPTEVALTSSESFIKNKDLQGLSLRDIALSVLNKKNKPIITHQMDMIFTHFGISGPAALRCSQFVVKELMKGRKTVTMLLDLIPHQSKEDLLADITIEMSEKPKKSIKNILKGFIPERFLIYILKINDINEEQKAANTSNEDVQQLIQWIKQFNFKVDGSLPMEKAFVTGGGVSIKEIIPKTMQSKFTPRLFFSGEILDIYGYTGGYNITSALVTGKIAGMNAAYEANSLTGR